MEETDQIKMPSSGSAVGEEVAGAQAAEAGTTEAEAVEVAAVEGVEEDHRPLRLRQRSLPGPKRRRRQREG